MESDSSQYDQPRGPTGGNSTDFSGIRQHKEFVAMLSVAWCHCCQMPVGEMLYECTGIPMYVCGLRERNNFRKKLKSRTNDLRIWSPTHSPLYDFITPSQRHTSTPSCRGKRSHGYLYLFITEELISFVKSYVYLWLLWAKNWEEDFRETNNIRNINSILNTQLGSSLIKDQTKVPSMT